MTIQDKARRLRWLIALAMATVIVGAVAAPVATIVVARQRNAAATADEIVVGISGRTADLLASELIDATRTIEVISLLLDDALEDDSVGTLMAAQMQSLPQLSGAFVGFPDGGFTFVRRDDDGLTVKEIDMTNGRIVTEAQLDDDLSPSNATQLDDTYDPRTRPWYASAQASDAWIWTEPYVFFSSGQPGVTAARAVRDGSGSLVAIVGVDLGLEQLTTMLDNLPISDDADAFILADDVVVSAPSGFRVARSADGTVTLATPSDVGLDSGVLAEARTSATPVGGPDDSRLHTVALDDPRLPDWDVAVKAGQLEFVGVVQRQSRIALIATIVAALALLAMVPVLMSRLRRPIDELSQRARIDHLTGLSNRATVLEEGRRELQLARQWDQDLAVAVLDIDNFKRVNDQYGHTVGDAAIRKFGADLRRAVRAQDLVGRLGGDEFVIVFRDLPEADTLRLLGRIHGRLVEAWGESVRTDVLGLTIGVARLGDRPIELADLIEEADHLLISAKRSDKGSIVTT